MDIDEKMALARSGSLEIPMTPMTPITPNNPDKPGDACVIEERGKKRMRIIVFEDIRTKGEGYNVWGYRMKDENYNV